MAQAWQPGFLYQPGAVVIPATTPPVSGLQPDNPSFESGDVDWLKTNWIIENQPGFGGTAWRARTQTGYALLESETFIPTSAGQQCGARAQVYGVPGSGDGDSRIWMELAFYDPSFGEVAGSTFRGARVKRKECSGSWRQITAQTAAPAGAAYFRVRLFNDNRGGRFWADAFQVTTVHVPLSEPIVYTAVQAMSGFSGAVEPAWPGVVGQTVVDNEVTWEALDGERVVWTASRVLVSGETEPDWPDPGNVPDNTILWQQDDRRVEGAPDAKIVALAVSKIFAGDDDIVPYSATVNPLDWESRDDAGYLPVGLQNYGSQPVAAMGLFEGNLVVFNSVGHQVWQVDEDPSSMALLSAKPVGSTFPKALQPVMNDLLFLSKQGVRSLGVAGASTNLEAGDVGKPIDILVQQKIRELAPTIPGTPGVIIPAIEAPFVIVPESDEIKFMGRSTGNQGITDSYVDAWDGYATTDLVIGVSGFLSVLSASITHDFSNATLVGPFPIARTTKASDAGTSTSQFGVYTGPGIYNGFQIYGNMTVAAMSYSTAGATQFWSGGSGGFSNGPSYYKFTLTFRNAFTGNTAGRRVFGNWSANPTVNDPASIILPGVTAPRNGSLLLYFIMSNAYRWQDAGLTWTIANQFNMAVGYKFVPAGPTGDIEMFPLDFSNNPMLANKARGFLLCIDLKW
jgi:hypothetical protein